MEYIKSWSILHFTILSICIFTSIHIHVLFTSNTFISNARLKLAKNQAKAKQHPETELSLFENYSHSSSTLGQKNTIVSGNAGEEKILHHGGRNFFLN